MSQRIDAIFENGVFRPETPVNMPNGERVSLNVESKGMSANNLDDDDLSDVGDLLDSEFMDSCRQRNGLAPLLGEVQMILSAFDGSLADRISEERDER